MPRKYIICQNIFWTLEAVLLFAAVNSIFILVGGYLRCEQNGYFKLGYWHNIQNVIEHIIQDYWGVAAITEAKILLMWVPAAVLMLVFKILFKTRREVAPRNNQEMSRPLTNKLLRNNLLVTFFLLAPVYILIFKTGILKNDLWHKPKLYLPLLPSILMIFYAAKASELNKTKLRFGAFNLSAILIPSSIVLLPFVIVGYLNVINRDYKTPAQPYNVILIGIDTLRADHCTLDKDADYPRELTPNIRDFSDNKTVFDLAISQSSWTMPSFASIVTGQYPQSHGAVSFEDVIDKQQITLAEVLKEYGYSTSAIVSHDFVGKRKGFGQGFDCFNEDNVKGHNAITSESVTDIAIEKLQEQNGPFFMLLHYFDPHYAYLDHDDFDFADDYDGWLSDKIYSISMLRGNRHILKKPDVEYIKNCYDEEIAYTDYHIGRFLDYVEEQGLKQNTVIIFVADHGEEFLERGWLGHTISIHSEVVHVPLVVYIPQTEQNEKVTQPVETRTIFSTVLDSLGIDNPLDNPPPSLLPLMTSDIDNDYYNDEFDCAFTSVWLGNIGPEAGRNAFKKFDMIGLVQDKWKLIHNFTTDRQYLYNLEKDPQEQVNLLQQYPDVVEKMSDEIREHLNNIHRSKTVDQESGLSDEEIQRLKSLGYL